MHLFIVETSKVYVLLLNLENSVMFSVCSLEVYSVEWLLLQILLIERSVDVLTLFIVFLLIQLVNLLFTMLKLAQNLFGHISPMLLVEFVNEE